MIITPATDAEIIMKFSENVMKIIQDPSISTEIYLCD
jgi:hypothetical protein